MTWLPPAWSTTGTSSPSTSYRASGVHLFCLHHAGGTTASFAAWRFSGVHVTKLGYRGRDFGSVAGAADVLAERMEASQSPRLALYGHSMGAILAFEWPFGSRTPAEWNTSSWRPLVRHLKRPTAVLPPPR